ncbi:unnamed protein product, partial [Mesorhabditis belari]|uniref:P/Homo B domain-containing protein n=1 Tax=Mesorhabditis belari TaxID=2138241 RepID=A0AAF3J7M7_9BILA
MRRWIDEKSMDIRPSTSSERNDVGESLEIDNVTIQTLRPNHPSPLSPSDHSSRRKPRDSLWRLKGLFYFFQASLFLSVIALCAASSDEYSLVSDRGGPRKVYTNEWAVRIAGGSTEEADRIARRYGFENKGRVIEGGEYFIFLRPNERRKATRKTRSLYVNGLSHEPEVLWMEQQVAKKRVKRDFRRVRRNLADNEVLEESQISKSRNRKPKFDPNDPLWTDMWYLNRADKSEEGKMDHNVQEAWDLGYTGKNVVVTILDDGLEHTHPDILPNYDPKASYDVNDRDDNPLPRYEYSDENRHGTRCAGEVAAVFNNTLCIVGIAYNANIGGIRMLDGDVTDAVEAASLSHGTNHIDVYSASWGPDDDGRTVDGPAKLTRAAFERGNSREKYRKVLRFQKLFESFQGRGGKGSIFVWASGNGGKDGDSCNCDGYTNSIYTLSISSATENGNIPWYSEACSSTLATAYSSGAAGEKMIVTTDLHHGCTTLHTGTSASAPLAAGIVALALEANPNLTWRDLQHLVVRTARPIHLRAGDWVTNGVGRNVSHSFGYGLMDAGAMNDSHGNRLQLQLYTDGCAGSDDHVAYVEHVQAIVTLKAPKRGDIQIYLTSPSNTRSVLLTKRARDSSRAGFTEWAFMTTHNWGEYAAGLWTLEVDNDGWDDAELVKWDLVLHGTAQEVGPSGSQHPEGELKEEEEESDEECPIKIRKLLENDDKADSVNEEENGGNENENENETKIESDPSITIDCQLCELRFDSIASLQKHTLKSHVETGNRVLPSTTDDISLECQVCSARMPTFEAFAAHMRSHLSVPNGANASNEIPKKCHLCKTRFTTEERLQQHLRTHYATKISRLRCSQCPQMIFQNAIDLGIHSAETHLRVVHQCAICHSTHDTILDFKEHFQMHSEEREVPACNVCDVAFNSEEILTLHIQLTHREPTRPPSGFPLLPPFHFPNFDFQMPIDPSLEPKSSLDSKGRRLHCSVCDVECDGEEALDEHRLIAHCKVLRGDRCSMCSAVLSVPSELATHSRLHATNGQISCAVCRQTMRNDGHLQLHSHFHLAMTTLPVSTQIFEPTETLTNPEERTAPTSCFACHENFIENEKLDAHLLKHDSEARCPYCIKDIKPSNLLSHIKERHGNEEAETECARCGKQFHFRIHLEQHQNQGKCVAPSSDNIDTWNIFPKPSLNPRDPLPLNQPPPNMLPFNETPKTQRCPICGLSFNTSVRLEAHIKKHNSTSRSICQICAKSFNSKEDLTKHMKVHKGNLETAARLAS